VKHLIVAQYQEDVSWLQQIEEWLPLVVTKGRDLPNEGRECSSFHWGIARLYDTLADDDLVACVQGDPFAHDAQFPVSLQQECVTYTPLGHWSVVCDMEGAPHHGGLPLARYWDLWVGTDPPKVVRFTAGGQFIVSGAAIKKRPRNFYTRMVGHMADRHAPWCMERLWGHLFGGQHG